MRALVLTAVLLGSSSLYPAVAQDEGKSQPPNQAQTVPVQPERTPRQSEQSRDQERDSAEDVRVGRGWRTQESDDERSDRMGYNDRGRTRDQTVGRNWRTRPDEDRADQGGYGRGYYDEDRPRRRVKVCVEY